MVCYLATGNETSDGSHSSDLVVRNNQNNFPGSVDWSHHEPIKLSAPGSVVHTQPDETTGQLVAYTGLQKTNYERLQLQGFD